MAQTPFGPQRSARGRRLLSAPSVLATMTLAMNPAAATPRNDTWKARSTDAPVAMPTDQTVEPPTSANDGVESNGSGATWAGNGWLGVTWA